MTSYQSQFTCSEVSPSRGGVSSLSSFANWAIAIMVLGVMSFVLALVVAAVASWKLRGAHKRRAVGGLSDLLPVTTPKVRTKPCCRRMYRKMRYSSSAASAAPKSAHLPALITNHPSGDLRSDCGAQAMML